MEVLDQRRRPLRSLRISVTDRCNLRCNYCMPEAEYTWLPRESLLTFEEIARLARIFAELGVAKIRFTGGEPLLRRDLDQLIRMMAGLPAVETALTTNGVLLAPMVDRLKAAGLSRVTVSLDTLQPGRMESFARSTRHADVLRGIDAVIAAGFGNTRLNTVVVRGYNDDEIAAIADYAWTRGITPRFIEYMDVGGATRWSPESVVGRDEIVAALSRGAGPARPIGRSGDPHAPAEEFRFANAKVAGVIASTTAPFCDDCDRARLTADGTLLLCLYAPTGIDLRMSLRDGATDAELVAVISRAWIARTDQGAVERVRLTRRGILLDADALRAEPRAEMHVRGG